MYEVQIERNRSTTIGKVNYIFVNVTIVCLNVLSSALLLIGTRKPDLTVSKTPFSVVGEDFL